MAVSVVLDACVLYPVGLRDTLLNLAEAGCVRVLWTEDILAETSRNIVEDTPGLTAEHLGKTFAAMRRAFPEAMVGDYEHLVGSMSNHPIGGCISRQGCAMTVPIGNRGIRVEQWRGLKGFSARHRQGDSTD